MQKTPDFAPQSKRPMNRREKLMRRGLPVILGATTLLGIGVDAAGHSAVREADRVIAAWKAGDFTKNPTAIFPKGTPMEEVKVQKTWEGAQEVVEQVDPSLAKGPVTVLEQKVEDYVANQGEANGHQLEFGQSVQVPIIKETPQK